MAESEKVEVRKLENTEKTQLLAEMGNTVVSRLRQKAEAIEEQARLKARKVSGSKEFKAAQKRIVSMAKKAAKQEKKLVKPFSAKDKSLQKKIEALENEIEKLQESRNKSWAEYHKEQAKRDKKRNKELKAFHEGMHKKFDDEMMYVDFSHSATGSIFVKAISADFYGMHSDHKGIQKCMNKWLEFRVKVIADPNWNSLREQFDGFIERL